MEKKRNALVTALFHDIHNEAELAIPRFNKPFTQTEEEFQEDWVVIVFTDVFTTYFASLKPHDFPFHARFYDTHSLSHGLDYYQDFHQPGMPNCLESNSSAENRFNFIKLNIHRLPQLQQFSTITWFDPTQRDHPTTPESDLSVTTPMFTYERLQPSHARKLDELWLEHMKGGENV